MSTDSLRSDPARGPLLTNSFFVLLFLSLAGLFFVGVRFVKGIGAVSNLSDGYPWGIWVAYDVAIGTAVTCGGFAVALLSYIMHRGEYHSLVKSAILTSLFGAFLAASSIVVEIGRPWNAHGVFGPTSWQPSSAFFELALCAAGYLVAEVIEYLPAIVPVLGRGNPTSLRTLLFNFLEARGMVQVLPEKGGAPTALLRRRINQLLILIALAGIVLPTMHQSALGSLMLIAQTKLHPLWHGPFLPLLFLINCIYIGYAIVIFESILACFAQGRPFRSGELASAAALIPWLSAAWLVVRLWDLVHRDQIEAVFHGDFYSIFFLAECFLMTIGSAPLFNRDKRRSPRRLFISASMMLLGGGLYRFNVYLIGFNPGSGWHYFPSFAEVTISAGIVSLEILAYQVLIKLLPPIPEESAGY
ncbi:Ni/Fe-hydrogenase 2 b-type cytochrome subunit HybB [Citrifermentans bremense]|uniref:Ni/Fe-hydrogenase 2 b-type cytochrome subunit HybB n=1 Tax=Citrifermentans bremense TaxID=60035 RepID=A0A6S6LYD9_9BACT|nr:Ni/Fe-hydrogenase cytochrome b subunit [Citrifermentans bremense]BCG47052.1 Ni/Fe-hydrogenase 2 b-type cytochrome subunit HybB [Citrifermentans bremense]